MLAGKDALCVASTGYGKSLCFQLPVLFANRHLPLLGGNSDQPARVCLVVSPLIALMEDQETSPGHTSFYRFATMRAKCARICARAHAHTAWFRPCAMSSFLFEVCCEVCCEVCFLFEVCCEVAFSVKYAVK